MRLAVLSLLILVSCYQEQPADRMWRCSAAQPLCPDGQTCVDNWCVKDGTATPDLASSDSAVPDMSKAPCTDGFPIGTQGAWACRGKFAPAPATNAASTLCQNGYKLCTDSSKFTDAECSSASVKGFFFADLPGQGVSGIYAKCGVGGTGTGSVWFGCGSTIGGSPSERVQAGFGCKGFSIVGYCDAKILFCNLTDPRLDAQRLENASNGVLCCPP